MSTLEEHRPLSPKTHAGGTPLRGEVISGENALGFERMQALLRGGYVPQTGQRMIDSSIQLDHPGKAPSLRLYPDGRVQVLDKSFPVHAGTGRDPFSILPGDDRSFGTFARFLEGVPQKKKRRLWRKFLFLALLLTFWFISVVLTVSIGEGM